MTDNQQRERETVNVRRKNSHIFKITRNFDKDELRHVCRIPPPQLIDVVNEIETFQESFTVNGTVIKSAEICLVIRRILDCYTLANATGVAVTPCKAFTYKNICKECKIGGSCSFPSMLLYWREFLGSICGSNEYDSSLKVHLIPIYNFISEFHDVIVTDADYGSNKRIDLKLYYEYAGKETCPIKLVEILCSGGPQWKKYLHWFHKLWFDLDPSRLLSKDDSNKESELIESRSCFELDSTGYLTVISDYDTRDFESSVVGLSKNELLSIEEIASPLFQESNDDISLHDDHEAFLIIRYLRKECIETTGSYPPEFSPYPFTVNGVAKGSKSVSGLQPSPEMSPAPAPFDNMPGMSLESLAKLIEEVGDFENGSSSHRSFISFKSIKLNCHYISKMSQKYLHLFLKCKQSWPRNRCEVCRIDKRCNPCKEVLKYFEDTDLKLWWLIVRSICSAPIDDLSDLRIRLIPIHNFLEEFYGIVGRGKSYFHSLQKDLQDYLKTAKDVSEAQAGTQAGDRQHIADVLSSLLFLPDDPFSPYESWESGLTVDVSNVDTGNSGVDSVTTGMVNLDPLPYDDPQIESKNEAVIAHFDIGYTTITSNGITSCFLHDIEFFDGKPLRVFDLRARQRVDGTTGEFFVYKNNQGLYKYCCYIIDRWHDFNKVEYVKYENGSTEIGSIQEGTIQKKRKRPLKHEKPIIDRKNFQSDNFETIAVSPDHLSKLLVLFLKNRVSNQAKIQGWYWVYFSVVMPLNEKYGSAWRPKKTTNQDLFERMSQIMNIIFAGTENTGIRENRKGSDIDFPVGLVALSSLQRRDLLIEVASDKSWSLQLIRKERKKIIELMEEKRKSQMIQPCSETSI